MVLQQQWHFQKWISMNELQLHQDIWTLSVYLSLSASLSVSSPLHRAVHCRGSTSSKEAPETPSAHNRHPDLPKTLQHRHGPESAPETHPEWHDVCWVCWGHEGHVQGEGMLMPKLVFPVTYLPSTNRTDETVLISLNLWTRRPIMWLQPPPEALCNKVFRLPELRLVSVEHPDLSGIETLEICCQSDLTILR